MAPAKQQYRWQIVAHPRGRDAAYNGWNLRSNQMKAVARRMRHLPLQTEHGGIQYGRVSHAFFHPADQTLRANCETMASRPIHGIAMKRKIRDRSATECSLSLRCFLSDPDDLGSSVYGHTPTELSMVKQGDRPGCKFVCELDSDWNPIPTTASNGGGGGGGDTGGAKRPALGAAPSAAQVMAARAELKALQRQTDANHANLQRLNGRGGR